MNTFRTGKPKFLETEDSELCVGEESIEEIIEIEEDVVSEECKYQSPRANSTEGLYGQEERDSESLLEMSDAL